MGTEQVKIIKLFVYNEVQPFFLKNILTSCCKPFCNLQNSEKVDFSSIIVAFMESRIPQVLSLPFWK